MERLACVNVPAFPLQLLLRHHPDWANHPVAVVAEDKPQGLILWVNEKARRKGVVPGLRYAGGSSLAAGLRAGVVPSAEVEEGVALLTEKLMRFTPHVEPSVAGPGVFWLSVAGLNLLHPSLREWADSIRAFLEGGGLWGNVVVGFSRFGTYVVARAQRGAVLFEDPSEECAAARQVSLNCLDLGPDFQMTLVKLGVKTVAQLLSLPAAGLAERFGREAYRIYRMAAGDLSAPLQPHPAREPIRQMLVLDDPETEVTRLTFLVKRLLHPVLSALVARRQALAELALHLLLERKERHEERIRPAAPTLDPVQLLELVRLRLEALELAAGVIEIELTAEGSPAMEEQLRFFQERPRRDLDAANRALARLRAEFGDGAVVQARLRDGHLPEARFTWQPLEKVALPKARHLAKRTLVRRILAKPVSLPSQPRTHEDGWLLLGPGFGPVNRLCGPYILSGGWWIREIHREYYFVETQRGDLLWVYYDKRRRRWFLQGWVE